MNKNEINLLLVLLVSFLAGIISISSHSIWVDEAIRIQYANISVENGYWQHQWSLHQMGLAHLQYIWSLLWGRSEVAYRMLNVPFLVISVCYMLNILRKLNLSCWWALLLCIHPVVVYYMNDAGPYIILLASSFALIYHCFFGAKEPWERDAFYALLWLLFGFCVHFIFGFAGVVYLYAYFLNTRGRKLLDWRRWETLLSVGVLGPILIYVAYRYAIDMSDGADRGWDKPGVMNLGAIGYAFLGLSGLGLPRNELRMGNYHLISGEMIMLVVSALAAYTVIFLQNLRVWKKIVKSHFILASCLLGIVFFAGAYCKNFHFWERHYIFLFPAFVICLIWLIQSAWKNSHKGWNRCAVVLLMGILLFSSGRLRWKSCYQKDDFKRAYACASSLGVFRDEIPILAQGYGFLYNYYADVGIGKAWPYGGIGYGEPHPDIKGMIMTDLLTEKKFLELIENVILDNSRICLLLSSKAVSGNLFYENAEEKLISKGYCVDFSEAFNVFKVVIISRDSGIERGPDILCVEKSGK